MCSWLAVRMARSHKLTAKSHMSICSSNLLTTIWNLISPCRKCNFFWNAIIYCHKLLWLCFGWSAVSYLVNQLLLSQRDNNNSIKKKPVRKHDFQLPLLIQAFCVRLFIGSHEKWCGDNRIGCYHETRKKIILTHGNMPKANLLAESEARFETYCFTLDCP